MSTEATAPVMEASASDAFLESLVANKHLASSVTQKRIEHILTFPEGNPKRRRVLRRMEGHAREYLNVGADVAVDWKAATFDWKSLLAFLAPFIKALIAALLGGL